MKSLFSNSPQLLVKQVKEMFEVVIDWETANKYALYDVDNNKIGFAAEKTNGIFHRIIRNIMRSHRSLTIDIWDKDDQHVLVGHRPWYFLFSDLKIMTPENVLIGEVKT